MDTGKIMMGTALLLIMIGLLVHPTGATETGNISLNGQVSIPENPGPVKETCTVQMVTALYVTPYSSTHT